MADLEKTIDGVERLQFFNQRAGRELWADKPKDVQDEDIASADTVFNDVLELLKEQPKWIPVSERLPKKEDIPYDCLVALEHGVVCEATFLDMDAPYHKWCANTGWLYHVTHWMPMPKPPKDGEQE